jgi:hypothetical protein
MRFALQATDDRRHLSDPSDGPAQGGELELPASGWSPTVVVMIAEPIKRWLRANIHPAEVWSFCFAMVRFAAFTAWGNLIVRLIRGEDAKEDWRTLSSAAALITFTTLTSAGEAREFATLRAAAVEMRGLVDDAKGQAELRDQRASERDRENTEQQARMLHLTKWLVALATITLAAALVTLGVTIAG